VDPQGSPSDVQRSRYFYWREVHPRFGRVERRDHTVG